jgi:CRP-like cAMP-binding protein/small-conductance mechanosensitive channel
VSAILSAILPYSEPLMATGALLVVAALVNWAARERRRELRRAVIMYVLYLVATVFSAAMGALGVDRVAAGLHVLKDLFLALMAVHLTAMVILDVVLKRAGIAVAGIVTDIGIGFAYAIACGLVLSNAGFDPSGVFAASTLVAAVLTVSLQGTLGNVIGGAALQLDGSFAPGDWLMLENGREGRVRHIRWRHTVLEMRNGGLLIVPNAAMLAGQILVLGKRDPDRIQHRYEVPFHVDFRFAPGVVIDVVEQALRGSPIPGVATEPPPECLCADFARDGRESYAYYVARFWLTDLAADNPTSSQVRERIFAALRRARIPLARPALMVFHTPRMDEQSEREIEERAARGEAALRIVDLFRTLTDDELGETAINLIPAPFATGEVMTHQGAVAHWLYVLVKGTAEVQVNTPRGPKTIATLAGPSVFGEMGLLTGEPRAASVVAVTDCDCYRLDRDRFAAIVQRRPALAAELSELVAHRRAEMAAAGSTIPNRPVTEEQDRAELLARVRDFFGLTR